MDDPADRTTVDIPDLVGLQMLGKLDDYTEEPGDHHIEEMEAIANNTALFERVVNEAVQTQFASPSTFARELGQNARDAYDRDEPRDIDFWLRDLGDRTWLEVRDYGDGMSQEDVFSQLLIPYNSGKDIDPDKIGEHGIGWFSALDVADTVEVYTGQGNETTVVTVEQTDGTWQAQVDTYEETFEGTRVMVALDEFVYPPDLRNDTRADIGKTDPATADIMFDGEKINMDRETFDAVGSADVAASAGTSEATLYMDQQDYPDGLIYTQDGLHITEEQFPFDDELRSDIFEDLRQIGYQFWLEVPETVGLTKGRDQVVAADSEAVDDAATEAFDAFVLEDLLASDEYDDADLDLKVAEWIDDLMQDEYAESLMPSDNIIERTAYGLLGTVYLGVSKLREKVETPSYGVDHVSFKGFGFDLSSIVQDYEVDTSEEPDFEDYYAEMQSLSEQLMQREVIDAVQVEDGTASDDRVSVERMIQAHVDDTLFSYPVADTDGLYVEQDNPIARTVKTNLAELDRKHERTVGDSIKESLAMIYDEATKIGQALRETDFSMPEQEDETEDVFVLKRTDHHTVSRAVDRYDSGTEYDRLLDVFTQLDEAVSTATGMSESKLAVHYDPRDDGNDPFDTAHAMGNGISINIAHPTVQRYLDDLRDGELNDGTKTSMMELYLHEKAHVGDDEDDPCSTHGRTFYREKRSMGYDLADMMLAGDHEGIDVSYDTLDETTDPDAFAQQVQSYLRTPRGILDRGTRYLPATLRF